MTCTCNPATGAMCDYALCLSDNVAKKESAARLAKATLRWPQPYLDAATRARNALEAHMHGGIPPEEQEAHCDCCGARGRQCGPENVNGRYGT